MYTGDNARYAPTGFEPSVPAFTTLKGTTGTLDLEDVGGAYTVANVEGSPSVTNGNLTVTNTWTLAVAALGENLSNISGTLSFGENATMTVTGDINSVHQINYLIAKAASISGAPRLVGCEGWKVMVSGGELRLVKPGLSIIVR